MSQLLADDRSSRDAPPILQVIKLMRDCHGFDLSPFEETFLAKSLLRRLDDSPLKSWTTYLNNLAHDPEEAKALIQSLNIGHSEFFRDPLAFALLEQVILPGLTLRNSGQSELRVWSTGCSSGQEAWSIAILLDEHSNLSKHPVPFLVFATDCVDAFLIEARKGVYDATSVQQIRLKHMSKYLTQEGELYKISPRLKQRVDFSLFNLLADGVSSPAAAIYGDFDLIFCCNLLFYYRPDVRQHILDLIYHALRPEGYFVTGEAEREIVARHSGFQAVASPVVIFQKKSEP